MAPQDVIQIIEVTSESHLLVFVAGSFSQPPWEPIEMHRQKSGSSGTTFRTKIHVKSGESYQYKFKSGNDVWFLDETAPTTRDENGNENNLLTVPGALALSITSQPAGPLLDLDLEGELDDEPLQTPLLAHESFGMSDVPKSDKGAYEGYEARQAIHSKAADYATEDIDPNDPNLEPFPLDRYSVMETLRKIQSRQSEDSVDQVLAPPHSHSRSGSSGSTADSPSSPIPPSPTAARHRERRLSHGTLDKTVSAVSLGSIAEEEEPAST